MKNISYNKNQLDALCQIYFGMKVNMFRSLIVFFTNLMHKFFVLTFNAELNPICQLLALLGAHHML